MAMLNKMTMKLVLVALAAGLTASAGAGVVSPDGPPMASRVVVGQVASVELVAPRDGSRIITSRVKTVEGRSYFAYGAMQGMEGTLLTVETARNGVSYLCGGVPKNCNALAE
jgi:hypothetical protein